MRGLLKLNIKNKQFIFSMVEEALADSESPDAKPSEYYAELSVILGVFNLIKDDPEVSDEDRKKISEFESKIDEKMKLKVFW